MKKLILAVLMCVTMDVTAQSFSDYKYYVLDNDCFTVVSRVSDSTITKHKTYHAQIVRPKILESGYLFVIVDDKGKDRYIDEMDFIKLFMINEIKK